MNRDLFLAILSMDSYNRGYGRRINLSALGQIGNGVIRDIPLPSGSEAANFYAIAYQLNDAQGNPTGETIVSYRGTTNPNPFSSSPTDFWSYGIGAGEPSQPRRASDGMQGRSTVYSAKHAFDKRISATSTFSQMDHESLPRYGLEAKLLINMIS